MLKRPEAALDHHGVRALMQVLRAGFGKRAAWPRRRASLVSVGVVGRVASTGAMEGRVGLRERGAASDLRVRARRSLSSLPLGDQGSGQGGGAGRMQRASAEVGAAKKVSEESVKRGPVSGLGRLKRSKIDLFGGTFEVGPDWSLPLRQFGGTLSVGPEPILEIPVYGCRKGHEGEPRPSRKF